MDKLYFYSKSKNMPAGSGVNEYVEDSKLYEELNKISNWRHILSNFHTYPFTYKNDTYNSIEHVFQSEKIAIADIEKAKWFTLESNHEIGQGDGSFAQKHRKLIKLTKEQLTVWDTIKSTIMKEASIAKYLQCIEAQNVLRATNDAELWHLVSRGTPIRFKHLEDIRKQY